MSRPTPFPMGRVAAFVATVGVVGFSLYTSIQSRRAQADRVSELELENLALHEGLTKLQFKLYHAAVPEDPCCDDYRALLVDHRELYDLHHEFMQWGPLRTPRDCVRETILMEWKLPIEETLWPSDVPSQLAHCINGLRWEHRARVQLVEAMDEGYCGSKERFSLPDLGKGDEDSHWIYPPGYEPDPATH